MGDCSFFHFPAGKFFSCSGLIGNESYRFTHQVAAGTASAINCHLMLILVILSSKDHIHCRHGDRKLRARGFLLREFQLSFFYHPALEGRSCFFLGGNSHGFSEIISAAALAVFHLKLIRKSLIGGRDLQLVIGHLKACLLLVARLLSRHADKQKTSFEMPDDELEITATYKTLSYELQVENGQGGGTYDFGKTVRITAQEKAGATFKGWVVKEGELELSEEEAASPELTISMPAADVVLAAEYDQNQHQVTINGGSGSGSYLVGETVTLVADEAGTGKEFTGWEVEEGAVSIQNANKQKASFEMPDGELVINAIFKDIDYEVSVNDGDGSGTYHYGDQVQVIGEGFQQRRAFFPLDHR